MNVFAAFINPVCTYGLAPIVLASTSGPYLQVLNSVTVMLGLSTDVCVSISSPSPGPPLCCVVHATPVQPDPDRPSSRALAPVQSGRASRNDRSRRLQRREFWRPGPSMESNKKIVFILIQTINSKMYGMVLLFNGSFIHPPEGSIKSSLLTSAVVVFLFLAGLWFTGAIRNGPNFPPKLTLAAPTRGYSVSCCVSCWLAQQDSNDG